MKAGIKIVQVAFLAIFALPGLDAASAERSARVIEEILVTATKREESLRDIPQSISAFTGEKLDAMGLLSMSDYLQETPGLVTNSLGPNVERIVMRGMETNGSPFNSLGAPVGSFIGDISLNDPYTNLLSPDFSGFDLHSVEVLKGPQGTLFGGSALAGAVRYKLAEVDPEKFAGKAFVSHQSIKEGESGVLTHGVALNIPILGHGGLRGTFLKRNYPGWIDDVRTEPPGPREDINTSESDQERIQALWEIGEDWIFKAIHMSEEGGGRNSYATWSDERGGPPTTTSLLLDYGALTEFTVQSLEVIRRFSGMELVAIAGRVEKEIAADTDVTSTVTGGPPPDPTPDDAAVLLPVNRASTQESYELRLQSIGDGALNWLIGAYTADHEMFLDFILDTKVNQDVNGPGSPGGEIRATYLLYGETDATAYERALFFDLQYAWGDRLDLALGARFYRTGVDGGVRANGLLAGLSISSQLLQGDLSSIDPTESLTTGTPVTLLNELEEQGISPRMSATWHFSETLSSYFTATRGFRFGGIQGIPEDEQANVPGTFKSDSVWNYEIGLRSDWLEGSLQLDTVVFYIEWDQPQISQNRQDNSLVYFDNVGAAISRGMEVSLKWLPPIEGLSWTFAAGYLDAYTLEDFVASGGVDVEAGTTLPGSADWQASTTFSWSRTVGFALASANVTATYVGATYPDIVHSAEVNDFTQFSVHASLSLNQLPGQPTLGLTVQNLTNESEAIFYNPLNDDWTNSRPRAVTMRLGVEF
jgi:iron complex outermembrane receptor protein